ncbi:MULTISPECIES: regulatory protein RecX [Bifidobacterium]|nr:MULTISPECIES: regulatory protein RecX [Bifidobacterium]
MGRRPRRGGFGTNGRVSGADGPQDPTDEDACREAALTLLDYASRSSGALAERLGLKGYDAEVIDIVVGRLTELGLIDDEAYAASAVRYCIARQMGRSGTLRELSRKGVGRQIASRAVAEADGRGEFVESAYELGRKVAARTRGLDMRKRRQRLWGAGSRKGHDPDLIRQVADELFVEGADDVDGMD